MKHTGTESAEENDIPSRVKNTYDAGLRWFASELWSSVLSIAASGLGKGVLMTATLAVAGSMLFGGGFVAGLLFLGSPIGMAAMAIGGLAGGLIEASSHPSSAAQAHELAAHYAQARERQKTPQPTITPANDRAEPDNNKSFRDAEMSKRATIAPQRACR